MSEKYVTKHELEKLRTEIQIEMKEYFRNKQFSDKKFLKTSQVKELLCISTSTLQNLRTNGKIPFTKLGGHLLYVYEDIMEILEKNFVNRNNNNL